jgi:protein TonB
MRTIFFILLILSCGKLFSQDSIPVEPIYSIVEVQDLPEFPGGTSALYLFIQKNIKYPGINWERDPVWSTVYISFVIEKDGSISGVEILKCIPDVEPYKKEAIRVIRSLPTWTPGLIDCKPVRVGYKIPVKFHSN